MTEIADSPKDAGQLSTGSSQEATKFEVRIRIQEKEAFRPGMSVTAEIETCYRTNVLTVPFASVTTRPPKQKDKKGGAKLTASANSQKSNSPQSGTSAIAAESGPRPHQCARACTNAPAADGTNVAKFDKKSKDAVKQVEVVFLMEGDHAKMVPVKIGISDDSYWEITEGVTEGQEVVSGGFKAITRELEDGTKIRKGPAPGAKDQASEN